VGAPRVGRKNPAQPARVTVEQVLHPAELAAMSPVLHLTAAVGVAGAALVLPVPLQRPIAVAALASLASTVIATMAVLVRPRTLRRLFRVCAAAALRGLESIRPRRATVVFPGTREWRKTERHSA